MSTPLGALDQWRRELAAGVGGQDPTRPSTWGRPYGPDGRADPLYRAACHEAAALDDLRAGLPIGAAHSLQRAADVIREAAQEKQRRRSA